MRKPCFLSQVIFQRLEELDILDLKSEDATLKQTEDFFIANIEEEKPPTALIIFHYYVLKKIKQLGFKIDSSDLSKSVAEKWKSLSQEQKEIFENIKQNLQQCHVSIGRRRLRENNIPIIDKYELASIGVSHYWPSVSFHDSHRDIIMATNTNPPTYRRRITLRAYVQKDDEKAAEYGYVNSSSGYNTSTILPTFYLSSLTLCLDSASPVYSKISEEVKPVKGCGPLDFRRLEEVKTLKKRECNASLINFRKSLCAALAKMHKNNWEQCFERYGVQKDDEKSAEGGCVKSSSENDVCFTPHFINVERLWGFASHIHKNHLIRGNLHSGNIVFICDLGLGQIRSSNDRDIKGICGVLPYIAPEVSRSRIYSQKADVYPFGIMSQETDIYPFGMMSLEIFTCETPFKGGKKIGSF
ncbi:3926_t:CDS:2 [Ambispora leptoticha]|uniref:3926_t:CDS:1 n=1 Tax=Ambispora leptoticha TaxID=144679 RepID=A0A9N8ZWR1_9GLOM|nr:3926_t:CDS:2 [Ambispora leptoticha]